RGRHLREFYVEPARWDLLRAGLRVARSVANLEVPLRRANRSVVWVLMSVVRAGADPASGLEGSIVDITARQRADYLPPETRRRRTRPGRARPPPRAGPPAHGAQRARRPLPRLPEPALREPAERLRRVGSLHEHERLAALEEAAEGHAAGAAHLDEGELRHVVVDHGTLDEGDLARAVEDHGDHLPRLDELGEAPRLVARPDPTRPVGVLLDGVLELGRLLEAIEDVGGLPVRRG